MKEVIQADRDAARVDAAFEYEAFKSWWRTHCSAAITPTTSSHLFGAWLASARHRLSASNELVEALAQAAAQAERGIMEGVRVMDLMGRGESARNLALHGNNLRAALRGLLEPASPPQLHGVGDE